MYMKIGRIDVTWSTGTTAEAQKLIGNVATARDISNQLHRRPRLLAVDPTRANEALITGGVDAAAGVHEKSNNETVKTCLD